MQPFKKSTKKIAIALVGGIVLLVGIIMIPYPGPGWLTVFAGLAILATEFAWAQNLLDKMKIFYEQWEFWIKKQPIYIRLITFILTGVVVIMTLWLINAFGMINTILQLHQDWLSSPLF